MSATASSQYDAIVIGSGIGGLVTATQLAAKGAKVVVLESYIIPGGSAGYFDREGYRFDVGASMIFGFGDRGTTNLLTRALAAVDMAIETIPDPVQIHYHLPKGLEIKVHRDYAQFLQELSGKFPAEAVGLRQFYDECWKVFNCLNSMDLLSLEEIRYLTRVFFQKPLSCLGLAGYLPFNAGDIARKYIKNPEVLKFIDIECYCWSVVPADRTPMINAGMVFADRHYGGINYPKGGVGQIAQQLVAGLEKYGGEIHYKSRVKQILLKEGSAVGVELVHGQQFYGKKVVSNATRWDTFGKLLANQPLPARERKWQQDYAKSPSFLSLHIGVKAEVLPIGTECHHIQLADWEELTTARGAKGTLFVSIPTLLDPDLAPPGYHIIHAFTPSWLDDWQQLTPTEYEQRKEEQSGILLDRLEALFPGLQEGMDLLEIGTPRTHRRFLGRADGSYGPMPQRKLAGLLPMPFNRTKVPSLYCVGDSTFPGQGLNAVAFSGFACAHRIAVDLGL
jgi:prolycopene isomerase